MVPEATILFIDLDLSFAILVLGLESSLKRFTMATSTSFSPSSILADDPVSQLRSIVQPSPTDFFEHESLDHSQPSIRLLKISPTLSAEGLVQCSISHTTIDYAPYRCLSYAWGEPEPKQLVLMNGKHFFVQPNLFEYLKVTRADPERTAHTYWIDAVCVDQENTVERNHQVMQMGRIYSRAETVIAWLGLASKETVLHYHGELQLRYSHPSTWKERTPVREARRAVNNDLLGNDYWTRAWITQELKLARRIAVAIGPLTITMHRLRVLLRGLPGNTDEAIGRVFALISSQKIVGNPLASLLLTFRDKKCSVARDRIFSLLALCSETHAITVDYGCSGLELVYSIMKSNEHTLCACSTLVVMQSLAPEIDNLQPNSDGRIRNGSYIEIETNGTDWVHIGEGNECVVLNYICSRAFATKDTRLLPDATYCGQEHIKSLTKTPTPTNAYSAGSIEPRDTQPLGRSVAAIGPGRARIRISLWSLFDLYGKDSLQKRRVQLCPRSWTGTNGSMTSIRVGYGSWDINAAGSAPEESVF